MVRYVCVINGVSVTISACSQQALEAAWEDVLAYYTEGAHVHGR